MEEKLTTYYQAKNYLLAKYAIDNFIAETEVKITNFKNPEHMIVVRYSEFLCEMALRCGHVYE